MRMAARGQGVNLQPLPPTGEAVVVMCKLIVLLCYLVTCLFNICRWPDFNDLGLYQCVIILLEMLRTDEMMVCIKTINALFDWRGSKIQAYFIK